MGINSLHTKLLNNVSRKNSQVALSCGRARFDNEIAVKVGLDVSSWIQR